MKASSLIWGGEVCPLGLQLPECLWGEWVAMTLPLCGCVGVHHAGRVHPGANSQRLLLHAGRGPSGKVVLDPEHLRGLMIQPLPPTVLPYDQENKTTAGKTRRKKNGKVRQKNSSCGLVAQRFLHRCLGVQNQLVNRKQEEDEEKQGEEEEKDLCRRKSPTAVFSCTTFGRVCSFRSTFDSEQRKKFPLQVYLKDF